MARRVAAALALLLALRGGAALAADPPARDLEASLGLLPGLIESPDSGAFVELVKSMDAVYPGKINIRVYPMSRSVRNLTTGQADFHLPALRHGVPESERSYDIADETVGTLSNVLYSNVDKKLTPAAIDAALAAMATGVEFPYQLETTGGTRTYPYKLNNQIDLALKKLNAGRIDGFIHPQEEADALVEQLQLRNIYRELYSTNEDIIAIPRGERGREMNAIVSDCLRKLRASGELERLYLKIHRPYSDWQPAELPR